MQTSPPPADEADEGRRPDRVILVHGTFAQDKDYWRARAWWRQFGPGPVGVDAPPGGAQASAWWRARGEFAAAIDRAGAGRFACDPEEFHWTGANKESQRQLAGSMLLRRLEQLERDGVRYHLVGHSHGGSVIWHALKQAVGRRRGLPGLRGWSTVGSPFLQFRPTLRDLWLLIPLAAYLASAYWIYRPVAEIVEHRHDLAATSYSALVALCGLMLLHAVALGLMLMRLLAVLGAVREERRGGTLRRDAWKTYGGSWRGVWSTADEAIGGLAASLGLGGAVAPRFPGVGTIRVEGVWDLAMFVPRVLYLGLLGPLYNAIVAPNVDRFVWGTATDQFHGNDRGGVRLAAVWNGPTGAEPAAAGLPLATDAALVAEADTHAADVLRQLRAALGGSAATPSDLSALTGVLGGRFAEQGLIHTAYFRNPEVQAILAEWIAARHADAADPLLTSGPADPAVAIPATEALPPAPPARPRFRLAWASPVVLAFAPLAVSAYASNALREAMHPFSSDYQVEQIVRDAPFAAVALVPMQEANSEGPISTFDAGRFDREWNGRAQQGAEYVRALASHGKITEAVEAALEFGYSPPLEARKENVEDASPLEWLMRELDPGGLDRVATVARGQSDKGRRSNLLVALAHELQRREQPEAAWEVGREALAVHRPVAGLDGPVATFDEYSIVVGALSSIGMMDRALEHVHGIADRDIRLASLVRLASLPSISIAAKPTTESRQLAARSLAEALPEWLDADKRGRSPLTTGIPQPLASVLVDAGRLDDLLTLEEEYARSVSAGATSDYEPVLWMFLDQLHEDLPIAPGTVDRIFAVYERDSDETQRVERWCRLSVAFLKHGNRADAEKALNRAFDLGSALRQIRPGISEELAWNLAGSAFREAIVRFRQGGQPDPTIQAAIGRFAELFGMPYDPLATGGVGDRVAEGIVLRDRWIGHATSGLGLDARPIALAVLAEVFRQRDADQGPGWACRAVHDAIAARPLMTSDACRDRLEALLKSPSDEVFAHGDRYVWAAARPQGPSAPGLEYSTRVADQIFSRIAPALARAGLEREAGDVIGRISDVALRHATWNEAIPHILAARGPERRAEASLPTPLLAEMRMLEVLETASKDDGLRYVVTVPRAAVSDFEAILASGELADVEALERRRLSKAGHAWLLAHLVREGRREDALRLGRATPFDAPEDDPSDENIRSAALANLQRAMADAGDIDATVEVAKMRSSRDSEVVPLLDASKAAANRGQFVLAREAARAIEIPADRARALAMLCARLRQVGRRSEADRALVESREALLKSTSFVDPEILSRIEFGTDVRSSIVAELTVASVEDAARSEAIVQRLVMFGRAEGPNRMKVFGMLGFFDGPWEYFQWIGRYARELGMMGACRDFLDLALKDTSKIKDEQRQSKSIADVAEEMARAGRFWRAREAAAPCLARDKLRAYTTVLREIASARAGR